MSDNEERRLALIELIEQAFGDVKLEDGISLSQSELYDEYVTDKKSLAKARAKDTEESWTQIAKEKIDKYHIGSIGGLSFLDEKGMRFYLPAFMTNELKFNEQEENSEYGYVDDLIYTLTPPRSKSRGEYKYFLDRFGNFTKDQVNAIVQFLNYLLEDPNDIEETKIAFNYWEKRLCEYPKLSEPDC